MCAPGLEKAFTQSPSILRFPRQPVQLSVLDLGQGDGGDGADADVMQHWGAVQGEAKANTWQRV